MSLAAATDVVPACQQSNDTMSPRTPARPCLLNAGNDMWICVHYVCMHTCMYTCIYIHRCVYIDKCAYMHVCVALTSRYSAAKSCVLDAVTFSQP